MKGERPTAAEAMHYIAKRNANAADVEQAQATYVGRLVTLQVNDVDARALKYPPRYRCLNVFLDDLNRLTLLLLKEDAYEPHTRSQFGGGAAALGM